MENHQNRIHQAIQSRLAQMSKFGDVSTIKSKDASHPNFLDQLERPSNTNVRLLVLPNKNIVLLTDGLSNPATIDSPNTGLGYELYLEINDISYILTEESPDQILRSLSNQWPYQLFELVINHLSQNHNIIDDCIEKQVQFIELPAELLNIKKDYITKEQEFGVLLGTPMLDFVDHYVLPEGQVPIFPIVLMMQEERIKWHNLNQAEKKDVIALMQRGNRNYNSAPRVTFTTEYDVKCWNQYFDSEEELKKDRNNVKLILKHIDSSWGVSKVDEVIELYKHIATIDPNYAKINLLIANAMNNTMGYNKEALQYIKAELQQSPESFSAHQLYVTMLRRLNQEDESITYLKSLSKKFPGWFYPFEELGKHYRNLKEWKTAIVYLEQATLLDCPTDISIWDLAIGYSVLGQHLKAADTFLKYSANKDKDYIWFNCGVNYMRAGKMDKALEVFKNALNVNPAHGESAINSAHILSHLGMEKEAIETLEKCILLNNNNSAMLYNNAGYHWLKQMDIVKAEKYLKESLEIEKIDVNHLNMGHVYLIKGEEEQAAIEYSNGCIKTKNIDAFVEMMLPDYADLNLIQYSVSKEQYIESLQKAVAICKENE